jgi:hypothetical protein
LHPLKNDVEHQFDATKFRAAIKPLKGNVRKERQKKSSSSLRDQIRGDD